MTAYADGTRLDLEPGPFAARYTGGRALCPDGVVRRIKRIGWPDTMWSVPAAVVVKGRTVSGYVSVEARSGSSVVTEDDPAVVIFRPYLYGKNHALLEDTP